MNTVNVENRQLLKPSSNTKVEFSSELDPTLLESRLDKLKSMYLNTENMVLYIVGTGGQARSVYRDLESQFNGIEVLWFDSTLPRYLNFFKGVIASYAGMIKVSELSSMKQIFLSVSEQSMAGIYIFPEHAEKKIKASAKNTLQNRNFDFDLGIKSYANYFFYLVDTDNSESSTGCYEIVSYGIDASYVSPEICRWKCN